jgi:lipopolysaccharide/colanic/teichoic acid biosynthesis glycosyltransferase
VRMPSDPSTAVAFDRDMMRTDTAVVVRATRRALDLGLALLMLVAMLPLMLVAALAIWIDSPGPVLFRQRRVGRDMKPFTMLKFRSMKVAADASPHREYVRTLITGTEADRPSESGLYKLVVDDRVTRIGRLLRKTSIDELPQLWNVLRGEMSLVGPRPPLPREVAQYKTRHYVRFEVAPGITGPWQVSGRNDITDFETVVELEQRYIAGWTVWRDLALLLRTVPAVLSMRGAL